jgi:hypothetical protein
MLFFWVLTSCRLAGRYQRFGEIYCLHLQGSMETFSETLVSTSESARRQNPAERHPHRRENLLTFQMMETVSSSETSVNICQTTRCNIPEDSHLHTRLENLKSCTWCWSKTYILGRTVICCSSQQQN